MFRYYIRNFLRKSKENFVFNIPINDSHICFICNKKLIDKFKSEPLIRCKEINICHLLCLNIYWLEHKKTYLDYLKPYQIVNINNTLILGKFIGINNLPYTVLENKNNEKIYKKIKDYPENIPFYIIIRKHEDETNYKKKSYI